MRRLSRRTMIAVCVTAASLLACTNPSAPPDTVVDAWISRYTPIDDTCGLVAHTQRDNYWLAEHGVDGMTRPYWRFMTQWVGGDGIPTPEDLYCPEEDGGVDCWSREMGEYDQGRGTVGFMDATFVDKDHLSGTLELVEVCTDACQRIEGWSSCTSTFTADLHRVAWGEDVTQDASCTDLGGELPVPGGVRVDVDVFSPLGEPTSVFVDDGLASATFPIGPYEHIGIETPLGAIMTVSDEAGGCLDIWRVDYPQQAFIVGGGAP